MTRIRSILALLTLAICFVTTAAYAQDNSAAQADNPLAKVKSVNIQNLFFGNLIGLDTDDNQFCLRTALSVLPTGRRMIPAVDRDLDV